MMHDKLFLGNARGMVIGPFDDDEVASMQRCKERLSPGGVVPVYKIRAATYTDALHKLGRFLRRMRMEAELLR